MSARSVAQPILSEFGGQCWKVRLGVWYAANVSNSNTSMILFKTFLCPYWPKCRFLAVHLDLKRTSCTFTI